MTKREFAHHKRKASERTAKRFIRSCSNIAVSAIMTAKSLRKLKKEMKSTELAVAKVISDSTFDPLDILDAE